MRATAEMAAAATYRSVASSSLKPSTERGTHASQDAVSLGSPRDLLALALGSESSASSYTGRSHHHSSRARRKRKGSSKMLNTEHSSLSQSSKIFPKEFQRSSQGSARSNQDAHSSVVPPILDKTPPQEPVEVEEGMVVVFSQEERNRQRTRTLSSDSNRIVAYEGHVDGVIVGFEQNDAAANVECSAGSSAANAECAAGGTSTATTSSASVVGEGAEVVNVESSALDESGCERAMSSSSEVTGQAQPRTKGDASSDGDSSSRALDEVWQQRLLQRQRKRAAQEERQNRGLGGLGAFTPPSKQGSGSRDRRKSYSTQSCDSGVGVEGVGFGFRCAEAECSDKSGSETSRSPSPFTVCDMGIGETKDADARESMMLLFQQFGAPSAPLSPTEEGAESVVAHTSSALVNMEEGNSSRYGDSEVSLPAPTVDAGVAQAPARAGDGQNGTFWH